MILIGSSERARATRHARTLPDGFAFHRSEWMEGGDDASLSPTVFLVEQPAGAVLAPHFHRQNQYQVVVAGRGRLGAHEVATGSVHYAGAFTGYGPIVAGPEGLSYFTVRAVRESGAHFVRTSRDKMVRGPKRHVQGPPLPAASDGELATLEAPHCIHLIQAQADQLGARVWSLPPGAAIEAPPPAPAGQFHFVMAGALRHGTTWLGGWESRYLGAREPACSLEAGPGGLQVLVLQMPAKAAEYRA